MSSQPQCRLDRLGQLRPRGHDAKRTWHRGGERRVAVAEVLDERMPTGDQVGRGRLLETAHRIEPLLEMLVVPFQSVVQVLRGPVLRLWQNGPEGRWIALRLIGGHSYRRDFGLSNSAFEKDLGSFSIAPLREVGVDDLASLIDGAVDVGPFAIEAGVRLINPPCAANRVPVGPGGVLEQRQEALDPAINRATLDDEAPFGEPLDDVSIAQAIPNVPAHG